RAVLTFAQALAAQLAVFEVADIEQMKLDGLPWSAMVSVAAVAALISLLTTIGKGSAGSAGSGVDLAPEVEAPVVEAEEEPAPASEEPVREKPVVAAVDRSGTAKSKKRK
ncbi:holin, partial [Staphylococcus pasteuri]|uniref:holin n=1 Tax=Staphylococcus pasteuri TaxID=45972 RepID=UPI0036FC55CE